MTGLLNHKYNLSQTADLVVYIIKFYSKFY